MSSSSESSSSPSTSRSSSVDPPILALPTVEIISQLNLQTQFLSYPQIDIIANPLYSLSKTDKQSKNHQIAFKNIESKRNQLKNTTISPEILPQQMLEFSLDFLFKQLNCPKCKCVISEPLELSCGHSLCRYCLFQNEELSDSVTCPICNQDATFSSSKLLAKVVQNCTFLFKEFESDNVGICGGCGVKSPDYKRTKSYLDDDEEVRVVNNCICCTRYFCSNCDQLKLLNSITGENMQKSLESNFSMPNSVEIDVILQQNTIAEVWEWFLSELKQNYFLQVRLGSKYIDWDSKCCRRCYSGVFYSACCWRTGVVAETRPVCELGSGCKQQFLDNEHAANYAHTQRGKNSAGPLNPFE
ncbi:Zinc finger, C3HC4 type (RING finger) domain-containing protein [Spironucleus salmonicida]|uniref:Zinc finger, C3HC4 type (RING finger) domain-containing protein n=1 Tax=Spironucleus salmonicida TaxID=348837 RepID=V6LTA8_9EUKA|nr:Zinc finger, C3HC4 type (RING finger) domain-containing protein [Spironucleus salmonicida]|eukprot:EST44024.1 Zinc finger, C3HC4 type (RING finger) domain-containing protein [Spironucleus salmonicida]